jgi:hypothetical protein
LKRAGDEGSRFVTEQSHIGRAGEPLDGLSRKDVTERKYDMRRLSYAGTFKNPWKAGTIRVIEWVTAKVQLLRLIRSCLLYTSPSPRDH